MRSLFAGLFLVLFSIPAAADTVTVNNGDSLNGEIVKVEKGKLHLKTGYAGTMQGVF